MDASKVNRSLIGEVKKHEWTNAMLKELIEWERISVEPRSEELYRSCSKNHIKQYDMCEDCSRMLLTKSDCCYAVSHVVVCNIVRSL